MSSVSPDSASLPELRLVLAVSLDGRLAPPEGGAAQIGGRGDREVLEESLAWADGCLIGAETLRRHGSTCLIHSSALLELRRDRGHADQPIAIVVSRGAPLAPDLPFFDQPLERWLLLAGQLPLHQRAQQPAASPSDRVGFQRILSFHEWADGLGSLASLGLRRVVVLGGACLASSLLSAGLLDEVHLTLCPLVLGGPHTWVDPSFQEARARRSSWRLEECRALVGDELLLRYRRTRWD